MNRIRCISRLAAVLASLAFAGLSWAAASPAAFARSTLIPVPDGDGTAAPAAAVPVITRVVVAGGMPGWQIALIAIGAAVFAAACAVLAYRALAGRRQAVTSAA